MAKYRVTIMTENNESAKTTNTRSVEHFVFSSIQENPSMQYTTHCQPVADLDVGQNKLHNSLVVISNSKYQGKDPIG